MAGGLTALVDRIAHRRSLARWSRLAAAVAALPPHEAARTRARAAALRDQLDRAIRGADARLGALPGPAPARPAGADWVWRPDPWQAPLDRPGLAALPERAELCAGVSVHHDAPGAEVTLRQSRALAPTDPAPFALSVDALAFDGSFLSLAIDLPPAALRGLRSRHLVSMSASVEMEREVEAFARLNIRHGPNTEQLVGSFGPGTVEVDFDLSRTRMNERRVEAAWLDLIFDRPRMNRILIAGLTLCRRPRAGV